MTHLLLAVALSWFGWAWLDGVPAALALSQLPAATIALAWAAEHADDIHMHAASMLHACSRDGAGQRRVGRRHSLQVLLHVARTDGEQ